MDFFQNQDNGKAVSLHSGWQNQPFKEKFSCVVSQGKGRLAWQGKTREPRRAPPQYKDNPGQWGEKRNWFADVCNDMKRRVLHVPLRPYTNRINGMIGQQFSSIPWNLSRDQLQTTLHRL